MSLDGQALVDVSGVGYVVRVPLSAVDSLQQVVGEKSSLLIHTVVRDDAIDLYGFSTGHELRFFKQLMSVSGIGPKTALGIMGNSDVVALAQTIARGDTGALVKLFGIGKKIAERLVVELRDKLATGMETAGSIPHTSTDAEVLEALLALGYRPDEVRDTLRTLPHEGRSTRELLALALRELGSGKKRDTA